MSRYQRDVALAEASEVQREQAVFRYQARYGQHPETEAKYRDAILACKSIDNLSLTITEIARMYGLKPEPFRNQLKRHFPDVLVNRRELRAKLGFKESGNIGLKQKTVQRYAHAIELLRDPAITVREAASRTEVSYQGLQQHLIFYHKDVAEQRLSRRIAVLDKDAVPLGGRNSNNRLSCPSAAIQQWYAPALEMLRTSDLRLTEVARRCHVDPKGLQCYVARQLEEGHEVSYVPRGNDMLPLIRGGKDVVILYPAFWGTIRVGDVVFARLDGNNTCFRIQILFWMNVTCALWIIFLEKWLPSSEEINVSDPGGGIYGYFFFP